MKLVRYLLFPVVPIYYMVTWLRNKLYDLGIKKSTAYNFPVICVGNLSVGGTGKTPMIEYLIRLLKAEHHVATLSRGYKRQTKGFIIADQTATPMSIGDEPFQFYQKFDDIIVSVDADRVHGISQLTALQNAPEIILLDDAFQHRRVSAGLNIMLTAFDDLYTEDILLPTGNLREPRQGAKRADIIVVTKCPENLSDQKKKDLVNKMKPLAHQEVFFGSISYSNDIRTSKDSVALSTLKSKAFTLVTGIANPKPLVAHLETLGLQFEHLQFKDHHDFSDRDIDHLKTKGIILTTEKDMVRLQSRFAESKSLYYLPIEMKIDRAQHFDQLIREFVK
ncbi:tetraacyldisaccharide 4'-kinase [Gelidibacter salicanalis]|uniref:Tetraacyldisaccharide 4'-kinase n=1 Tax=Gelidibacter salicanalis TaxID=291193 RepID=A0A934KKU9_9FLAO|nr:tetraacyldisaccharide 4'-kinase [Gelidibacter salicanalis]MBJ7879084.1 tetraacyldisaccharide 4'-kinase [Gelidibacter salicanalis]